MPTINGLFRFLGSTAVAAFLAACSGHSIPDGNVFPSRLERGANAHGISILLNLVKKRPVDFNRRYLDQYGRGERGLKVRGRYRSYWFPADTRLTALDDQLLIVAYGTLFTFRRDTVAARDNFRDANIDVSRVISEPIPSLAERARDRLRKAALKRSTHFVAPTCDVSDAACDCPDCSTDPTSDDPLTIDVFLGDHGAAVEAYYQCSVYSPPDLYNQDYAAYQACLASSGFTVESVLYNALRQNCRDYAWYSGNQDTYFLTQSNPVVSGAKTYTFSYNSLFDGPYSGQGSFIGFSTDPNVPVYFDLYPTESFGFSQSRYTYYSGSGPVGGSLARLARVIFGSRILGT